MSESETCSDACLLSISTLLTGLMVLLWCADATQAQDLGEYDSAEVNNDRSLSEIPSLTRGVGDNKDFHAQDGINLVTNGGFEDGLKGWSEYTVNLSEGGWFEQTGNESPFNGFTVPEPPEGTQAAMSGQSGLGLRVLYQEVFIPEGEATLQFDLYAWSQGDWAVPESETLDPEESPNQHIRVDIMDPDSPIDGVGEGVLKTVFLTDPENDPTEFGYDRIESDLTDLSGQTVRIRFAEVDNQNYLNVGVDDVVLTGEVEMQAVSVDPDAGGNEGTVTMTVFGFGFEEGFEAKLVRDGHSDNIGNVTDVADDGTHMSVGFDLIGQAEGDWNLVVADPDGDLSILNDAFTVVPGERPELWTRIQGRNELDGEGSTSVNIHYGNSGEADLYDILLYVHLPADLEFTIDEEDIVIPAMEGAVASEDFDGGDEYKEFDPYFEVDNEIVLPLWIYQLPARSSETLQIEITTPDPGLASSLSERLGSSIRAEIAALPPEASEFTRTGDFESSDPGMLTHFADLILIAAREAEEGSETSTRLHDGNAIVRQTGFESKSGSCSPGPQPDPDDMIHNNREEVYGDIFSEVDLPSGKQWAVGLGVGFAATVACGSTPIGWGTCAVIGGASGALALNDFFNLMDNYDDLGEDGCDPPGGGDEYDPELCEGDGCGGGGQAYGDPHLMTLDRMDYDFQAVGEFILTRSTIDDLEVQARMEQMEPDIEDFTILTAVAMHVAGDEVVVEEGTGENQTPPYTPTFRVNGSEQELPEAGAEPVELPGGGTISRLERTLVVEWPDHRARVDIWQNASNAVTGNRALGVELVLSKQYRGNVEGLLGTMDGNIDTDFTTRDGTVLQRPLSFDELYRDFGDGWRISQEESLFGTETFADLSIPAKQLTVDDLDPNKAQEAEQTCKDAGVDDPVLLNNCIFDVVLSDDTSFAEDAARLISPRAKEQVDEWMGEDESKLQIDLDAPSAPGQEFTFSAEGIGEFTLSDDGDGSTLTHTEVFYPLTPGTYEVSQEASAEDWTLESITCDPEEGTSTQVEERKAILELEEGKTARCTFEIVPAEMGIDIVRTFDDPTDETSYRLVALPGAAGTRLAATLEGTAGDAWRAFRETGADGDGPDDYLDELAGSDRFAAGEGYWLLAEDDWSVTDTIEAVELREEGAAAIPLREGWNIIANPFARDLDWAAVKAANDVEETLWRWSGSYDEATTFASARGGEAYYFFNEDGREELMLPYPSEEGESAIRTEAASKTADETVDVLRVDAEIDGTRVSGVSVGLAHGGGAEHGYVAPPGHFEAASLRLSGGEDGDADRAYARLVRPIEGEGMAFDLTLEGEPGQAVDLSVEGLEALAGQEVVLVDRAADQQYDLREVSTVTITPGEAPRPLRLLVGSESYVQREAVPDELALHGNYPNPFSGSTTIEYALPERTKVELEVFDVLGRRVATLERGEQTAGFYRVRWDGRSSGGPLASGVYFVRLRAEGQIRVEQVTLVR